LGEVVEHKIKQAYVTAQKPILVEDTALEFCALGKLPGTFIKFFIQELGHESLCRLLDGKDRLAIARTKYAFYDGAHLEIFTGELR
jgi:inosine triphosphate pyrophosphatase